MDKTTAVTPESKSPETSGIGEDITPTVSPSPSSFSTSIHPEDQQSTMAIIDEDDGDENRSYEVKFSGIDTDKDSIMSSSSSSSSSLASSEEDNRKNKIPDGGWGWMVVLASLILSMIADGVSFSFGLLYVEFLKEFNESKSKTAWIGSLFMAVPLMCGPIMSSLVDRYFFRNYIDIFFSLKQYIWCIDMAVEK